MANRSEWTGGNLNSGSIAYQSAFGAEVDSLAAGNSVLSSVIFDNTTGLDQFFDISAVLPLASSQTFAAQGAVSFWMAVLQANGTTYGDGRVSTTPSAYTPPWPALGQIIVQNGTVSSVAGDIGLLTLRPVKFALIMNNGLGCTLAASGLFCSIRSYNQNFNN